MSTSITGPCGTGGRGVDSLRAAACLDSDSKVLASESGSDSAVSISCKKGMVRSLKHTCVFLNFAAKCAEDGKNNFMVFAITLLSSYLYPINWLYVS